MRLRDPRVWLVAGAVAISAVTAVVVLGVRGRQPPQAAGVPAVVDFNFHVRPILSDRCFKCHGPDDRARKGGLRLDTQDGAVARLPSGRRAIVAGSRWRSELVRRILSTDPDVVMPVPDSHLTLDDREKAILVRWIDQGADWQPHWAFTPPSKPAVPPAADERAGAAEIDAFVLAKLREQGLEPAALASRETLIRRVSFDLTGLPPTLPEIDAFLADPSPEAYEKVVDRLLASPAYGERMASEWLDLARYADSHGYQDDGMRDMSPWRDWVIAAFNRNLPFDRFVTWQLAGDLLPDATEEQRLATGFNRHHMQSQEGGVVPEEYRVEYVADRVNTLGRAFLGVSLECARCHDHKYDPVSQKEYFQVFAFFNSINETGQIPYSGMPSPTVVVKSHDDRTRLQAIESEVADLEGAIDPDVATFDEGFARWLLHAAASPGARRPEPPAPIVHLPLEETTMRVLPATKDRARTTQTVFANLADRRAPAFLGGDKDRVPVAVPGRVGQGRRLVGDSHIDLGKAIAFFERHEPFSLAIWFRIDEPGASGPLVTRSGGVFNGNRGYELMLHEDGRLTAGLHHVFPDNSVEIETVAPVAANAWHHLTLTYDGSSRAAGLRLFLDGRPAATRVIVDHLRRSIIIASSDQEGHGDLPGLRIGRRHDETLDDVSVDELRVYDFQVTTLEAAALAGEQDPIGAVLGVPEAERTPEQRRALREHFVLRREPGRAALLRKLTDARRRHNELLTSLPEVMAMRELPTPRPTFVLARGAYDAPTDPVSAGTPRAIRPFPEELPPNRLGLARWLVNPEHPLTARVIVNRYWALLFGTGIVATPDDFGSQGELPTHPALLDWLATTFVESGWDLKALHKRIVMSATYRQSSVADVAARERDPRNRWLARGPSHRLSAEQVRDGALAVSGLLVRTIGGPSVYPYQPPGLWEELATRNATTYVQGRGDDLYRRSLYTVWKRSTPPPSAVSFDAAERLVCTVSRQRTSTPLQALVLMNDPQYVEAARMLGERMLTQGGQSADERIAWGFRLVTSRPPTAGELDVLRTLLDDEAQRFGGRQEAATRLLRVGEHPRNVRLDAAEAAAYTVVANTLLSFDEAVNKR